MVWCCHRLRRGGLWTVAVCATLGFSVAACSGSRPHRARVSAAARPTTAAWTACVDAPGYGGLGARTSAFDANNDGSTGPAAPTPGTAWYAVTATERGCVTAFSVQDAGSPPLTARELLVLVSDPYLPRDAKRLVLAGTCGVWKSATLQRATGRPYATAIAIAQIRSLPGRAAIAATSKPAC